MARVRSVELRDTEADLVVDARAQDARFAEASDADLSALRTAVEPVYAELAREDTTARFIGEIETPKQSVSPEPLAITEGCVAPTGDTGG